MHPLSPILIAEDSDDDFFFFRRSVRAAGVENPVLRFRDGTELTRYLDNLSNIDATDSSPWLLFVDITMPIMNGFEVLEWLRERKGLPALNAIVLSGSFREEDVRRGLSLGATDYLVKPISPALLGSIVMGATNAA